MKHKVLARISRYAVVRQLCDDPTPFVLCCGYCDRTKTWGQGIYYEDLRDAMIDYYDRIRNCRDCEHCFMENHPTWCIKTNGGVKNGI